MLLFYHTVTWCRFHLAHRLSFWHLYCRRNGPAAEGTAASSDSKLPFYCSIFFSALYLCSEVSGTDRKQRSHAQIGPLPRVDGLAQQENLNSSANWKSWGGSGCCAFAHLKRELNLFWLLGSDHRVDAKDSRGITEQDDNAGGEEYVGLALLLAPQPWPS